MNHSLRTRTVLVAILVGAAVSVTVLRPDADAVPVSAPLPDAAYILGNGNPLHTNGTWSVPAEIRPGKYLAEPMDPYKYPFWELCSTAGCGAWGSSTIIDSGHVDGPTYVTVPETAASLRLQYVRLLPMPA